MAEEAELGRRRRWPRVLAGVSALLALVLLGLWVERKPIARGQVDRLLAQAHVPARYGIGELGPGRQRLTGVVLGDPQRPDLVADWIETETRWGFSGPYLAGVRGGHVRVRARWVDGRLSLGALDRLLPKGQGGGAFTLPALALNIADLRARVETPWGLIGAKLVGQGRLDGGFDGRLAVTAVQLGGACGATRPAGAWRVRTGKGLIGPARLLLDGSAEAETLSCAGVTTGYANANGTTTVTLGDRIGWSVTQDIAGLGIAHPLARARALSGGIVLEGASGRASLGRVTASARDVVSRWANAHSATLAGPVAITTNGVSLGDGGAAALAGTGMSLAPGLAPTRALADAAAGTPVAPLLRALAAASSSAIRRFDLAAQARGSVGRHGSAAAIDSARLTAATGATLGWRGEASAAPKTGAHLRGYLTIGGGGLPAGRVALDWAGGKGQGVATLAPYQAGGARLALSPILFSGTGSGWRVTTRAELSGPLSDGRIEGLTLPVAARWWGGTLTLAGGCAPVSWRSVAVSRLRLDPATLRLCPTGAALLSIANGHPSGGVRLAATRLTGQIGSTPLTLAAAGAEVRLADRGFALDKVDALLGKPERVTHITAGRLEGRFGPAGLAGRFTDAGGGIGAVPLLMSAAAGDWRFAHGALALTGALTLSDADAPARFQPMAARDVAFTLTGNRIAASGALHEPTTGTKVADVALTHDLAAGRGTADLTVANLAFVKAFQPELLTRLTFGVIADVRGTVTGGGHLAWDGGGVTSTGAFRTAGTDLAAAFGPVQGLAGEIRFTDLLQLRSAPGQRVTVKSINPGVPVTDGVITFQTLPATRVAIEGGRWPFAGGTLTLDPTLLDFSGPAERRMTFHVAGAEADKFLQSFDFKNLNATGVFDGVLPMVFDSSGGRIADGRLTVRPGGGTIAYVGDLSQKQLGFWGDFAFGALRSLRYRSLGIVMNGPLAGEMVTEVRFAGVSQGEGAKSNFLVRRLQRLPIVFNIHIRAPFRGLLDATASFYDPKRLIERNLPQLIEQQKKAIQPPASETVP